MISVTDLRAGIVFEESGQAYQVLSYEHIKMGRGSANIKVKVKNVRSGATTEKSFINGARVKDLQVFKKQIQYLYKDEGGVHFMDPVTFEQVSVPLKVAEGHQYLKEGETYTVAFLEDEPIMLALPSKVELVIAETGPGVRGNSATNIFKDAILENGIKTKIPLFLQSGNKIRVDTRTGAYTEKV